MCFFFVVVVVLPCPGFDLVLVSHSPCFGLFLIVICRLPDLHPFPVFDFGFVRVPLQVILFSNPYLTSGNLFINTSYIGLSSRQDKILPFAVCSVEVCDMMI